MKEVEEKETPRIEVDKTTLNLYIQKNILLYNWPIKPINGYISSLNPWMRYEKKCPRISDKTYQYIIWVFLLYSKNFL